METNIYDLPLEILHYIVYKCMDCATWIRCMQANRIFHVLSDIEKELKKDRYLIQYHRREFQINGRNGKDCLQIDRIYDLKSTLKKCNKLRLIGTYTQNKVIKNILKNQIIKEQFDGTFELRNNNNHNNDNLCIILFPTYYSVVTLTGIFERYWLISPKLFLLSDFLKVTLMFRDKNQYIGVYKTSLKPISSLISYSYFWGSIKI